MNVTPSGSRHRRARLLKRPLRHRYDSCNRRTPLSLSHRWILLFMVSVSPSTKISGFQTQHTNILSPGTHQHRQLQRVFPRLPVGLSLSTSVLHSANGKNIRNESESSSRIPKHIAFVCDGNSRWAKSRGCLLYTSPSPRD